MSAPTSAEKAQIIATCAAGIMAAPNALTIYNESNDDEETFREWAVSQAVEMAISIFERVSS